MAKANRNTKHDQIIIDPDRPQTKYAQRLTPYEGPVPSYIEEREHMARRAGLSCRRLSGDTYCDLVSAYAGTRDQIEACDFIASPKYLRWPNGVRVPSSVQLVRLAPDGEWKSSLFRISDDRFAIEFKENLPIESKQLPGAIEHYRFKSRYNEREIFIGTKDQLIKGKFADQRMFPDDSTETGRCTNGLRDEERFGHRCFCVQETSLLSDGKFALIRYPDEMAQVRELKKQREEAMRSDWTSPEKWLESIEDFICHVARTLLLGKAAQTKTKSGFRYSINVAHSQDIIQAIEVAAQRIRDLPVKVEKIVAEEGNEADRDRVSAASMDALFQRFIGHAVGAPPNSAPGA